MRLTCLKSASVCNHHCYINANRQTITDETRDFTVVIRDAGFIDTITDETRDSPDTFDTKFWDSIKLMNPCVFDVCQYLRVLRLSCLSCSIVVVMVVTSMQTDRQSISGVCHEWLNSAIHGLRGIAARKLRHIRPHGNFILSGVLGSPNHGHPWLFLDYCCLSCLS